MLTLWNIIKKFPGTVAIVITTLLGIVLLNVMFPERAQLVVSLGAICLVIVVAYRVHKVAGHIITALMVVAIAFWLPKTVSEAKRVNDPNGTFASFFAKAKQQTMNASRTYAPGATSQASLLAGVMSVDAKLSGNLDKHIVRTGSTIDTLQLTLDSLQIDSLLHTAATIKENQKVFQEILTVGGITGTEPVKKVGTQDTIHMYVDVANEDGATFKIPKGKIAQVSIDSAWYTCTFSELRGFASPYCDGNGHGIVPNMAGGGKREHVNRFLNPDELMGAVLVFDKKNPKGYRLAKGQIIVVTGNDFRIAVNDWRGGWFGGEGGSFTASKELQRGGFYDNQGILRVLIVLKPLV